MSYNVSSTNYNQNSYAPVNTTRDAMTVGNVYSQEAPNPDILAQQMSQQALLRDQSDYAKKAADQNLYNQEVLMSNRAGLWGGMANDFLSQFRSSMPTFQSHSSVPWTEALMQKNINANRAHNDAATANQVKQMQSGLAGRGYGSDSPLAQSLTQQYQAGNLSANADYTRGIQTQAAQQNSDWGIKQDQNQIAAMQPWYQQQNALLQALAGAFG